MEDATKLKKYQIIYADPPWSYRDKALAGNRGAGCKYDVMDTGDIGKLPIADLADENCVLFMWVTMPKLNECFDLIRAWGFEYKTNAFTWIKLNKNSGTPFMGMGRWTRANAEICLLATKGKPQRINAGVHSVVMSPIEEHSKKPHEIRERIVTLLGDVPRIELFARNTTPGWDVWGNEVESDIKLAA
jgi:N6-adenosine-specific RNA methylase IME4